MRFGLPEFCIYRNEALSRSLNAGKPGIWREIYRCIECSRIGYRVQSTQKLRRLGHGVSSAADSVERVHRLSVYQMHPLSVDKMLHSRWMECRLSVEQMQRPQLSH